MEKSKKSVFKFIITFLLSAAVLGAMVYVILKGDLKRPYLSIGCMAVCFLLSLLFIGRCKKKIYITLALAANIAAYYFWVFDPLGGKDNMLIGVSIFCGVQFFYMLYSLSLSRAIFVKIINLAIRVALCLVIWFIVRKYVTLTTIQVIGLMYLANALVTLIFILFHIKTEWLTFIGFVFVVVASVFSCFIFGGVEILKLSSAFLRFLMENYKYVVFATHIVGTLLVAISSVFAKRKSLLRD